MFKFDHEISEMNLIISAIEHKIQAMQELRTKLVTLAQAQVPQAPVVEQEKPQE
jgi:hypothetical protein